MPLVLSLKKGQDFYCDEDCFVVEDVMTETSFKLRHKDTGKTFEVDDRRSTEIMQDVFVSAGQKPMALLARVTIEAPQSVIILRGPRHRQSIPA